MVPTTSTGRRGSNGKQQVAEGERAGGRNGSHRESGRAKGTPAPKPAAKRGRKAAAGPGLVVERRWTTAGVDPFDAVEWDYRTAAITGEKGETVFEQRDVEVPRFWSQLATNVVVSKYFRGHLGDPAREHSVKQLIGRVVKTISGWGRDQGYFASDADADVFRDELCHMLLHQKAAFNSPVWFNVGLPDKPRPQCSACQPFHAPVNTPYGRIPIGQIVDQGLVGLEVCDAQGTTRVLAVKHNGRKSVLRVHTMSGHSLDVTSDHLVWRMRGGANGRFVEAGTLRPGDRLAWHRVTDDPDKVPDPQLVAEAALAGWLQSDGFVGQYEGGTNRSLTIEAMTMNDEEFGWVLSALRTVFPDVHYHIRDVETRDPALKGRRIRLYGEVLRPFVQAWGLTARGTSMAAPERLAHAPLAVVAAYLKSIFQAEGYVKAPQGIGGRGVGLSMIAPKLVHDLQDLLARFGIYARVRCVPDARPDRKDGWLLTINPEGDRRLFAQRIGFVDSRKNDKLAALCEPGDVPGVAARERKSLHISHIEELGERDVYDIQTQSGEYLSGNLRVHNCFINSVEDTMESIMQLAATEARLFKGGSGAGSNLSRIRSSRERLQGGGIASGPVSFMRGYDAFAGVIKSGGTTRRAAKMVILDIDHPDVVEFIRCKADEEKKAWALIDAGYDGGFNVPGGAYDSVFFQNANHSVRVSDEFMHAVQSNGEWNTRFVLSKEPADTYKARDLLRMIAEGTHVCGDPGMQFDTTINRWHTCKATDRIYASNPCSEYMFLEDSACNLASLNLLRFRHESGEFDVAEFVHGCEVMITAQEILVDNASYPTEKIAINSHDFRPLGLGYANLGALLMARGLPYDSDEGRALAGAITAVMTGAAYRQSARIAEHKEPFPGYAPNREAMLEVMALHRSHVEQIDHTLVPGDLMAAAHGVWDETLELGRKHGYKNAQISVLAPTGTIAFLMDCDTTGIEPDIALVKYKTLVGGGVMKIVNQTVPEALERCGYSKKQISAIVDYIDANGTIEGAPGLREEDLPVFDCAFRAASGSRSIHYMGHVRMMAAAQPFISGAISKCVTGETLLTTADGLVRIGSLHRGEKPDSFRPTAIQVASTSGNVVTDAFYYGGFRSTIEATLRSGQKVTGTPNHRLLTLRDSRLDWVRLDDIEPGTQVGLKYGADLWASHPASLADFVASPPYRGQKRLRIPGEMSVALARFLGIYAAEGHTTRTNWTITISHAMVELLEDVRQLARDLFGVEGRIDTPEGKCPGLHISSKTLVEFLSYLGIGDRAVEKRIPDAVLRSPREMVLAFLSGLYLDGYLAMTTAGTPKVGLCLASDGLLDDVQAVLTNLGIIHGHVRKWNSKYERHYCEVFASGRPAVSFAQMIRWLEPHKIERAAEWTALQVGSSWSDVIPGVHGKDVYAMLPYARGGKAEVRSAFTYLLDPRTHNVSWESLRQVSEVPGANVPEDLLRIVRENIHFVPVREVRPGGVREVFDLSVPETHAFVGNGIVNHNTVNVPEDATVEEIERTYVEAWKAGLKAVAIYRDNSKRTQPLSTKRGEATKAVEGRPYRRKLPDERNSITHKFSIAGHEGYVTVGMYEDRTPGEIFITMSKEGSTISGLMDSFATAISLALQYGVPLQVLVTKFSHARFEPAGWTNNKEIPVAKSVMDYIFRWLALKFLTPEAVPAPEMTMTNGHAKETDALVPSERMLLQEDAPPCSDCGSIMVRAGACYRCLNCGSTSGCG